MVATTTTAPRTIRLRRSRRTGHVATSSPIKSRILSDEERLAERAQRAGLFSKHELEMSTCRDDLATFVKRFWSVVIPEKLKWNWHMDALCHELQQAAEVVFRNEECTHDLVVNVPPGTSKSSIFSIFFPAWAWTRMPSARFICGSHTHHLSLDLSRKCRMVVQSEKYRELFGDPGLLEDQNAKGHFVNRWGGGRQAISVDGKVTGFHAHFIVIDDPLDPNAALSTADLATANRWMTETIPSRKVDKETTLTVLVMQRLHQNDPSAVLLDKAKQGGRAVRHINLPAEIEGSGRDVVRPRKYAARYRDGLLDCIRLTRKVLGHAQVTLGEYGYAGQFLQRPVPRAGGMFKVERIKIEDAAPRIRWQRVVRYWDKAGTSGGGAFSVGAKLGVDGEGRYWILDVVRGQWDSATRELTIKSSAILDGKGVEVGVEQEPGSGGKESAESTARMLAGWKVRIDRVTGSKETRADTFSVQVNAYNVRMVKAPWNQALIEELRFFPKSRYKDQVDALSGAFGQITRRRVRVGAL